MQTTLSLFSTRLVQLTLWILAALTFAGCTLSTSLSDESAPLVIEFVYPTNNVSVAEDTDLQIQIAARSNRDGVARLELWVDGELIRTAVPIEKASVPIFVAEMNWLASGAGFHVLEAIAYNTAGELLGSTRIRVNVASA